MKIRATLLTIAKVGAVVLLSTTGCGSRPNKIMADTAVLPYQAPDISEITGIEEPDDSDSSGDGSAQAPAPENK